MLKPYSTAAKAAKILKDTERHSYHVRFDPLLGECRIDINFDPDPEDMGMDELQLLATKLPEYLESLCGIEADLDADEERPQWEQRRDGVAELLEQVTGTIAQWDAIPPEAVEVWSYGMELSPSEEDLLARVRDGNLTEMSYDEQKALGDLLRWYFRYLVETGPEDKSALEQEKWQYRLDRTWEQLETLFDFFQFSLMWDGINHGAMVTGVDPDRWYPL